MQTLVQLRDRQQLAQYHSKLKPNSQEWFYAGDMLRNSVSNSKPLSCYYTLCHKSLHYHIRVVINWLFLSLIDVKLFFSLHRIQNGRINASVWSRTKLKKDMQEFLYFTEHESTTLSQDILLVYFICVAEK